MPVTLFEDTLKNVKVGKRPKRGTKSSNFGASFSDRFLEPRTPKIGPGRRSYVFAVSLCFVVGIVAFGVVVGVVVAVVVGSPQK